MGFNLLRAAIRFTRGRPPKRLPRPASRAAGVASLSVTALDGGPVSASRNGPESGPETGLETSQEFSARIVAVLDGASLALLLSVGRQTGLLDTMAGLGAATS